MACPTRTLPLSDSTARARGPAGTILFVSAPSDDREMYAAYFRHQGFGTVEVQTAAEAYACALTTPLSAVIVDVRLPGDEDGVDFTRRLKRDPRLGDVPVVVVTGYLSASVRHAAEGAGCDLFVAKPCLPDALVQMITLLIGRSTGGGAHDRDLGAAARILRPAWRVT